MRFNSCLIYVSLLFIFESINIFGQNSKEFNLDDIRRLSLEELLNTKVTVSSPNELNVFNTPSTVTVIDRQQLDRYCFTNVAEALSMVAGIDVLQTIMDNNVVTSRGVLQNFYSNKILLMINNVPTWQSTFGYGQIDRVEIQDVERIEILKGPASVLYGSNAFTGVVNIILKEPGKNILTGFIRTGLPNIQYSGGLWSLKYRKIELLISANGGQEVRHPYEVKNALGYDYMGEESYLYEERYAKRSINSIFKYGNHTIFINNYYYGQTVLGEQPSLLGGGGKMMNNYGTLVNYKLGLYIYNDLKLNSSLTYDGFNRNVSVSFDDNYENRVNTDRYSAELSLNYKIDEKSTAEIGSSLQLGRNNAHDLYDSYRNRMLVRFITENNNVLEHSIYGQFNFSINHFSFLTGIRYTDISKLNSNVSGRLSALYQVTSKNVLKLIWGQSFRLPTVYELYFNQNSVVGNPYLREEKCESIEFAYLYGSEHVFFQGLIFANRYNDLIHLIKSEYGPPDIYINNEKELISTGVECELKFSTNNNYSMFVDYGFVRGMDEPNDDNFKYVPDHKLTLGLSKSIKKISFSLNGKFLSECVGANDVIKAQYFTDFHLGYNLNFKKLKMKHRLSLKNVTGSKMLTPEYIRQNSNINSLETMGYGRRLLYTVLIEL